MTSRSLVLGGVVLLLAACSQQHIDPLVATVVPSSGIKTSELKGSFAITGESGKLTAHASFAHVTNDDLVMLDGADAVYCDGVRLQQSNTWIGVDLPRKAAGQSYRFELRRANESVFVEVAAIDAVKVLAPTAAAELSRAAPVTLTWAPNGGTAIDAQLFANCAMTSAKADAESGSITLPAFVPVGVAGGPQNAANPPCEGTVSLARTRKGTSATTLARTETIAEETDRVPVRVIK